MKYASKFSEYSMLSISDLMKLQKKKLIRFSEKKMTPKTYPEMSKQKVIFHQGFSENVIFYMVNIEHCNTGLHTTDIMAVH